MIFRALIPKIICIACLSIPLTLSWGKEPNEGIIGISPKYSNIYVKGIGHKGFAGGVIGEYILTDAFSLLGNAIYSIHNLPSLDETRSPKYKIVSGGLGIGYHLDLLPFTPSFECLLGLIYQRYQKWHNNRFSIQLGLTFDYPLFKWFSVGFGIHYITYLGNPLDDPVYFDLGPRLLFH